MVDIMTAKELRDRIEVMTMMLQPSEEELKLYEKLNAAKSETEREEAIEKLREYLLRKKEELRDCPFAH